MRFRYKKATAVGLVVMAIDAIGFIPATNLAVFPCFLQP